MVLSLKTRIWLTVLSIVLMFTFFTLIYFPAQERRLLIENSDTELQNLANTVALGVSIALTEQHFEGVEMAMQFVKDDPRLEFVSIVEFDTLWNEAHNAYDIKKSVFKTYPEDEHPDPDIENNSTLIVKKGSFNTPMMSGNILLAFNTNFITDREAAIRRTSLIVSGVVLLVGVLLGFFLARKISVLLLALRDAANRIGEGDFSQRVHASSTDEIGQLGKAFNMMADDLEKSRTALDENNRELSATNLRLNTTLEELQTAQVQLIQSEKMASLGELTAGIAHEIQNPLNFVNNFSELNKEMLVELNEELNKGNFDAAEKLSNDLIKNEEKISHHGKRADSIVKGMLQHSRSNSGDKQPVAINALCDEYLNLSYHGFRAKNKSLNVSLNTHFDGGIDKINVNAQDIGRVLLNICNNAFYAVYEKFQTLSASEAERYTPTISLATTRLNDNVAIYIIDNGIGIPKSVADKIFQPFFTTKPTGQGTGLGLSLAYDIIKAHGGEIQIESEEGEGSKFNILLPEN